MGYQWSPDYSSFIDTSKNPNAVWRDADPGGGSEGAPSSRAGWYNFSPGGTGSEGYVGDRYDYLGGSDTGMGGANDINYWKLKDAGLWNLTDPNSDTWKYLQSQGGGGDVRSDINAFARALMFGGGLGQAALGRDAEGRAQVENAYKEALAGLNPDFANKFANAIGGATEGYWEASKQNENQGFLKDIGDTSEAFRDMLTQTPLGAALAAATGGAIYTAAGGGTAGAATAGGVVGGSRAALSGGDFGDVLKGAGTGALTGAAGGAFGGTGTTAGAPVGPDGMPMPSAIGGLDAGASPFLSGLDSGAISGTDFSGVPSGGLDGLSGGAGMEGLDWLDGIGDPIGDFTTNPSLEGLEFGGEGFGLDGDMSWLDGIGDPIGDFTTNPSLADLGGDTSAWTESTFAKYGSKAVDLAKKFFGGGGSEVLKELAKLGVPAAVIGGLLEKKPQSPLLGPMTNAANKAYDTAGAFAALPTPGTTPSQQRAITVANENVGNYKPYLDKAAGGLPGVDLNNYMNPYIKGALDPAADAIRSQASDMRIANNAKASMRGAFGGSRASVEQGALDKSELGAIGDLYKKGYSDAFDRATGSATTDLNRTLQVGGAFSELGNRDVAGLTAAGALERQPYEDERAKLADTAKLYTGVIHGTAPAIGPTTPDSMLGKTTGALTALGGAAKAGIF